MRCINVVFPGYFVSSVTFGMELAFLILSKPPELLVRLNVARFCVCPSFIKVLIAHS